MIFTNRILQSLRQMRRWSGFRLAMVLGIAVVMGLAAGAALALEGGTDEFESRLEGLEITLINNPGCPWTPILDGLTCNVDVLTGPTVIRRDDAFIRDNTLVITTEVESIVLTSTGTCGIIPFDIEVRENPDEEKRSFGLITTTDFFIDPETGPSPVGCPETSPEAPPCTLNTPANSFFDVFIEADIDVANQTFHLYSRDAIRMAAQITMIPPLQPLQLLQTSDGYQPIGLITGTVLYGAAYAGPDGPSSLFRIDPLTGATTFIGPIGFERVSGMDFIPQPPGVLLNGNLFGAGERTGSDDSVLITIDQTSGQGREIGPTFVPANAVIADVSRQTSDFDGLYAYLKSNSDADGLGRIDANTGQATTVGPTTLANTTGNGIAFAPADTNSPPANALFHADNGDLNTLNITTGAATPFSSLNFPPPADTLPRVNAMDFEPGTLANVLFASVNDGTNNAPENYLTMIDAETDLNPQTGDVTIISQIDDGMDALAFAQSDDIGNPEAVLFNAPLRLFFNGLHCADLSEDSHLSHIPLGLLAIEIDVEPDPAEVDEGDMVEYTYQVTNPGHFSVSNVAVSDDTCSPVEFQSGDGNNNNQLDPDEIWTYICSIPLFTDTTNTATVTGDRSNLSVSDSDMASVNLTAITLVSFTAAADADHVTLAWETGTEIDNAGFNLWRSETADGEYTKINDALIPAQGDPIAGGGYEYIDADVVKGKTYYYKLEDVDTSGVSTFHGPISTKSSPFRRIYLPLIVIGMVVFGVMIGRRNRWRIWGQLGL